MGIDASVPQAPPEQRIRAGASWFFWVAALSLVNSIAAATGAEWGFAIGLGITQVIDALAGGFESGVATGIALALDLLVAAAVVGVGFGARRYRWLYLTGMVLFALDGLLFLVVQDWVGLGFHAFVIAMMIPGVKAFSELRQETESMAMPTAPPETAEPAPIVPT